MAEPPVSLNTYDLPRAPGCKCNDYQLAMVGCDCGASDTVSFGDDIDGAAAAAGHSLSTPQTGYFDGIGFVTNSVEGCEHQWEEINCEPPYDICTSCGAKRE